MKRIYERIYGWRRDLPDFRDHTYTAPFMVVRTLPPMVDLRPKCPAVYDQGQLGSCTANAIAAAHQFEQLKQGQTRGAFVPSRLFIYWNERNLEGTTDQDSGAQIRDGMKTVAKQGVCPETEWPYIIGRFTDKPNTVCYKGALNHQVVQYAKVSQTLLQMKGCLADGFPFVFGFSVYSSFESATVAKTGIVPMPTRKDSFLGGHAVLCCGYDDTKKCFIVRNSWGSGWGKAGYCFMPYLYLTDSQLASDLWKITLVEV